MRIEREIRHVFGVEKASVRGLIAPLSDTAGKLDAFAGLWIVRFFFTDRSFQRWATNRTIEFPPRCCVCSGPITRQLSYNEPRWLRWRQRSPLVTGIPHCNDHGAAQRPELIAFTWTIGSPEITELCLIGRDQGFLRGTKELNLQGDVFPPWIAFPLCGPVSTGWRQGNGEYWISFVWRVFWFRLSKTAKQEYLTKWKAPQEWREYLEWLPDPDETVIMRRHE